MAKTLISLADLTSRYPSSLGSGLECGGDGPAEHAVGLDGGQPEGELVGKVVAGAAGSVTLDEGRGPEVL